MPIQKPGRVLLHNIPLKFVHDRVAGGGRKAVDSSIALVPFSDFLIELVVFLLISFSATGELLAQQPNLQMPSGTNVIDLEISPIIAINPQVVTLDAGDGARRIADTSTLAASPEAERIEPLIEDLQTAKRNWSILHPSDEFPGTVILQADKSIDFRVIKKIMYSTAQAGYANVSFAVNRVSKSK